MISSQDKHYIMINQEVSKKTKYSLSIFIIFMVMFLSQTSVADVVRINIHEKTELENDRILLGEIAHISGDNLQQVKNIQNIDFGSAPLPGMNKKLDKHQILARLKQKGIDSSKVQITVPDKTELIRGSLEISEDEIKSIVLNYLDEIMPWEKRSVSITDIHVSDKVVLPKGNITYKVVPPSKTRYLGKTPLSVYFLVNGKNKKKIWVTAYIEVMTEVVVTRKPLGRFKVISDEDIHLISTNLAKLSSNVITRCEDVIGKRTKRSIDSNVALRSDLIELPPLVKNGDIVRIVLESDGLLITTLGRVKEKGRRGEMIKVINVDSRKTIYARVLNPSSVAVDY